MSAIEENAILFEQLNRELATNNQLTAVHRQKMIDAATGVKDFTLKMNMAQDAVSSLANAFISYNKEIYRGSTANQAAAVSIKDMAQAAKIAGGFLVLLAPGGFLVKGLVAALTMVISKSIEASAGIAEHADALYKGTNALAEAAAVGQGGLQDVFRGLQKVGLGTEKFSEYVKLVSSNSKDLALFSGTVLQGRKTFEDTMEGMKDDRVMLSQLGMADRTAQAEATMAYLKQQRLLTLGTKEQMNTSSAAVVRYIKETDELARITGINRKEQEKIVEAAMRKEAYAAKIDELIAENKLDEVAQMKHGLILAAAAGKDVEAAYMDGASGFLGASDMVGKAYMTTGGKLGEFTEFVTSGKRSVEEMNAKFREVGKASTDFYNGVGKTQAGMNNLSTFALGIGDTRNLVQMSKEGALEQMLAKKEQDGQLADLALQGQAERENAARELQLSQQALVNKQMEMLSGFVSGMTTSSSNFLQSLNRLGVALEKLIPPLEKLAIVLVNVLTNLLNFVTGGPDTTQNVQPVAEQKNLNKKLEEASAGTATEADAIAAAREADVANAAAKAQRMRERINAKRKAAGLEERNYENLEARAAGGPVGKGTPYLVGEEGPELFVPSIAGDIVPLKMLSGTTGASLRQSENIEKMVKNITLNTMEIEKATDADAKLAKDYSKFFKTYIELKTTYEKKQIDLINYQTSEGGGGGGGGSGGGGGGSGGLQLTSTRGIGSMGGGRGLAKMGQSDLAQMGLMIKSRDTQAEGAGISPALIELAKEVQEILPGFAGFTAFNDKFHNEKAPSSRHTKGTAMDFVLDQKPSREQGRSIISWLQDLGASLAIDEYNNPSAGATGGHIHAEIPAFGEGGELGAGKVGIAGEAGPELVTGPASITPMNDLTRALDSMSGLLQQSVMKLDEISRATQRNGDINDKMLSYAQN